MLHIVVEHKYGVINVVKISELKLRSMLKKVKNCSSSTKYYEWAWQITAPARPVARFALMAY